MHRITIHCSDIKPGILAGEAIIFNTDKLHKLFKWPMAHIPSIPSISSISSIEDDLSFHVSFRDFLKCLVDVKTAVINIITNYPAAKRSDIYSDKNTKDPSIKILASYLQNLYDHIENIGLETDDFDIRLYNFCSYSHRLKKVKTEELLNQILDQKKHNHIYNPSKSIQAG